MTDASAPVVPSSVLARWGAFAQGSASPLGTGLINRTFLVEHDGQRAVLQELHPVFGASVNDDLDAVTRHLESKGLTTPRLVRTDDGATCVVAGADDGGRPWRMTTFVAGQAVDRVDGPARARAAGALVARFHAAVEDLRWEYRHVRVGVHDTRSHLVKLARAMAKHRTHRLAKTMSSFGREILDAGARLPDLTKMPLRHSHGDLKISNLLFDDDGNGVCLVDLDTLQRLQWPLEMGDALRSWCNPHGEDVEAPPFDADRFAAAIEGYFSAKPAPFITFDEADALVDGVQTICTELAARFAADALNESYFGWDARRFATRGDHNLARARGQFALARSVASQRAALADVVKRAFQARA